MVKVIKIGTTVNIHNQTDFKLKVTMIKIGNNNSIQYLVRGINKNGSYCEWWVTADEITSKHKEYTIINQCLQ